MGRGDEQMTQALSPNPPGNAKLDGAADSDNDDKDSESDSQVPAASDAARSRAQRNLPPPNRKLSPYDVRFSQMRARHEFRDAKLLEDTVSQIKAVRCDEEGEERVVWRLEAPFPPIEVLKWRCKLRDETTGRPKTDPVTGDELWDSSDHWFTLDNRRLYCYQKAAIAVWPDSVVIDVVELPPGPLTRIRELKKFRTLDCGRSVMIGGRNEGETLVRWSWWEALGFSTVPEGHDNDVDDQSANADGSFEARNVQLRQRPRRGGGGGRGRGMGSGTNYRGKPKNHRAASDNSQGGISSYFGQMSWGSLCIFLGIYVSIRFLTKLLTAVKGDGAAAEIDRKAALSQPTPPFAAMLTAATSALVAACVVHLVRIKFSERKE